MPKVFGYWALVACTVALILSAISVGVPRWSSSDTFTEGIGSLCLSKTPHGRVCLQYYTVNHYDFMGSFTSGLCRIGASSSVWATAGNMMNLTTTQVVDHIDKVCSFQGTMVVATIAIAMFSAFVSLVVLFSGICLGRLKTSSVPVAVVCIAIAFLSSTISLGLYSPPPQSNYAVSWFLLLTASVLYVVAFTFAILYRTSPFENSCVVLESGHYLIDTPQAKRNVV